MAMLKISAGIGSFFFPHSDRNSRDTGRTPSSLMAWRVRGATTMDPMRLDREATMRPV